MSLLLLKQGSDSDQSSNVSDANITLPLDRSETSAKKLLRSDSWTFYDATPGSMKVAENVDEVDRISNVEEESLGRSLASETPTIDRNSCASNESQASIQNSLYENLSSPPKVDSRQQTATVPSDTRQQSSKSLLFEFDPYAKTSEDESVYGNYENNDLMLLEALLATNDSPSSADSTLELRENADIEEDQEDEDLIHPGIGSTPPEPPKRYDSLPKNEYDVAEGVEQPDKVPTLGKNPPLLPKLAHLVTKKQPAVPPRKPNMKNAPVSNTSPSQPVANTVTTTTTRTIPEINVEESVIGSSPSPPKIAEDHSRVSVMQKLKKLRHESSMNAIKPNVISFVKSGSKLLSRTREHVGESGSRSLRMERPKVNTPHKPITHKGMVYR